MTASQLRALTLDIMRWTHRIVKPWKKGQWESKSPEYVAGWNDCVKEIAKNSREQRLFIEEKTRHLLETETFRNGVVGEFAGFEPHDLNK